MSTPIQKLDFSVIKSDVRRRCASFFSKNEQPGVALLQVEYDRDAIWNAYISAFEDADDRQSYNCNACRGFIRQVGGMVLLEADLTMSCIWDPESPLPGVRALHDYVMGLPIERPFYHDGPHAGTDKNRDSTSGVTWQHFHVPIPREFINEERRGNRLGRKAAEARETRNVLRRALEEIPPEVTATVLELIAQGSLYRGAENKATLDQFAYMQQAFAEAHEDWRDALCWKFVMAEPEAFCRIRNTSIGTLLVDLAEGVEINKAVKSFETKVGGANYQRPTALVTPGMVEAAKKRLEGPDRLWLHWRPDRSTQLDVARLDPPSKVFPVSGREHICYRDGNAGELVRYVEQGGAA